MDAIRIKDGTRVVLKIVEHHEWSILRHLTTPQRRSDPRNRTVHVLDEIRPEDDDRILIAMPLLHLYYSPPFQRIGEIFEAIRQFLSVGSLWLLLFHRSLKRSRDWNSCTRTVLRTGGHRGSTTRWCDQAHINHP